MEFYLPPAAPSIKEFGANVKAAQMVDEEIENYQDKIRVLKTRRNALVLISRLPPELLSTIFQLVQSKSNSSYPYERTRWTTVSHVCGHWRRVALQSPSLWSHIDIHGYESGAWVEAFLERSKQALLTLSAKLTYRSLLPIGAALDHMGRMQHLSLSLQSPMAQVLLNILETRPAPVLEHFQITCTTSEGSGRLPDKLFAGNHPSLRVLRLTNCDLSWNLPPLYNLVTLQISNSSIFTGSGQSPSILQLISIFKTSPNLEQLDLDGLFPPVSQPGTHTDSPILLPRLSEMSLKSSILSGVELLNHISYSATSSVSIQTLDSTRHKLEDIFRIMRLMFHPENIIGVRPPIRYLKVTSPRLGGVSLKVDAGGLPWSHPEELSEGPKFSLKVHMLSDVGDPSVGEGRNTFWSILPLQGLDCLEVAGLDLSKLDWLHLSGHLENLTILKLDAPPNKAATSILEALSSKRPVVQRKDRKRRQKAAHLHFPALRELSITSWDFETPPENQKQTSKLLKHLITCLKMRKKLGAGIETLNIEYCRYLFSSGVDELKKVVPQVTWDMSEEMTDSEDEEDEDEDEYYGYDYWGEDYGDDYSDEDFYPY